MPFIISIAHARRDIVAIAIFVIIAPIETSPPAAAASPSSSSPIKLPSVVIAKFVASVLPSPDVDTRTVPPAVRRTVGKGLWIIAGIKARREFSN